MRFTKALGLAAGAAMVCGSAFAADSAESRTYDDRYYFGLGYQFIDSDEDRGPVEDSHLADIFLGRALNEHFNLELGLAFSEFDRDTNPNVNGTVDQSEISLSLDALYFPYCQCSTFRPYVVAGAGVSDLDFSGSIDDSATNPLLEAGLGAMWGESSWGLRADVRHRWSFWDSVQTANDNDSVGEWQLNLAVVVPFGDEPEGKVEYCEEKEREYERKRREREIAKAQAVLAGAGIAAMAPGDDADADGVKDDSDRCPGTPAGLSVDEFGCPTDTTSDSDGDGVADALDNCADTPAGTVVDINGCPVPETVVVYFGFDSDQLNAAARRALTAVAANLKASSFIVAIANGHADSSGTAEYNMGLSERRAKSVVKFLTDNGVPADQVRVRAYGETRPAADDTTEANRAKNRRVEVQLLRK